MNPEAVAFYEKAGKYFLSNQKAYAESFDDDELDRVDKENTKSTFDDLLGDSSLFASSGSFCSDFLNEMLDKIILQKY